MKQLVMLPVKEIQPHPNNPRKDLGDLSELTESIKKNGIMQNLTVVKNEGGGYTVIIGHRRLEAAKAAGVEKVPCAVAELDEGEQLATMLLENMQRQDLTVYEQAEGIQLLLDMDFSVSDIAQKTGFSESTVRRRTKLLSLDRVKFKESQARQVSLKDYEQLFEIEDKGIQNELLDKLGTADFNNDYRIAVSKQKYKRNLEEFKQELRDKKVRLLDSTDSPYQLGYTYFSYLTVSDRLPKLDLTKGEFAAKITDYADSAGVSVYRKDDFQQSTVKNAESNKKAEEALIKSKRFTAEAKEINERMTSLRRDFINNFSIKPSKRSGKEDLIIKALLEYLILAEYTPECILYNSDGDPVNFERVYESDGGILIMLSILEDQFGGGYVRIYDRNHAVMDREDVAELNRWYYLLTRLGYELCKEEKQLRDGTHEIYTKYKD